MCLQNGTTDQDREMLQTCDSLCRRRGGSMCAQYGTTNQDREMLPTSVHHGNCHQDGMLPSNRDLHRVRDASQTCVHHGPLQHMLLNSNDCYQRETFKWFHRLTN